MTLKLEELNKLVSSFVNAMFSVAVCWGRGGGSACRGVCLGGVFPGWCLPGGEGCLPDTPPL